MSKMAELTVTVQDDERNVRLKEHNADTENTRYPERLADTGRPPPLPTKKKRILKICGVDYYNLKNLDFDKYIKENMEDFVLCDKKDYGGEMMIECPSESFDALEQYVAKFKDSIVSTTAEFEYPECNQLLFKKSGYANEIVLGHLSAKAKRIVCYFDIELDVDGKPKCIIYATSISDLQKAKAVVENSIVRTDCPMETFKKMEETLRQYELKNLLQVFENKEIVTYVCTKDALMDINNEYQHEETIIVSQPFMSYIRDKGEHEFQKMQKENYVDIQLVPEQHALVIKGSHRHIAKSKNMLKSMFVKRDNRLSLTSKQLRALENKLQSIEEKFNCCCSIDCMKDGKEIFFPFKEIHAIAVAVDSGSILDVQAEVLVNTVGTDLKLDTGFLSSQILKEAGSSIQKELTDKNQELPCKSGTCLVTTAGNLSMRPGSQRTKLIIHCVLPKFKKESFTQNVRDMVRKCLIESDVRSCHSVAFPAFGTGKLGYPTHETVKAMFDAVEDYQHQAINPTVHTVFLSSTDQAFKQEETIRHQKNGQEQFGISIKGLTRLERCIQLRGETVFCHIVVKKEMDSIPPNAIIVIPIRHKHKEIKHYGPDASTNWNIEVHLRYSGEQSLKDCFIDVWKKCTSERCTEMVVNILPDDGFPPAKQINEICNTVQHGCPVQYLRNIVFTLNETAAVDAVEHEFTHGVFYSISNFSSSVSRGRKVWEKIPGSKREVCVRLIGSSEKDVDGAESFLMDQDSNDRDTQKSSGSAQLKSAEKAYAQELEVSARINAGVLNYLNEWKALSDWKDQVTKVIKVNIKHDQVFGTHDAIMKFWNYLENEFPELPSIPATDLQEQDDAEIIPFGEFMITVKRGSIVESNTDCIVCLNGPTLTNTGGVAGAMKKVGGEAYVTELGKNVKQFGKLMCGECRVTDSGELQAKKVMHIYFPPFKDNFDIHMQQMLELALFVSLETADAYGFKSMSFPVLGTGHGGLTVGHCVNAYAHTFSKANGKLKNTRNIFVYAFDEKVQTSFSQAFRKHHPSTDDYHLDKGRFNIAKRTITVVVPELCNTLSVNAIISKVDEQLAGKSSSAQKIESLGNEEFFLKKESLKKECPLQKNYVLSQGSTGGQLLNVAIMHLNEPRWNILKDIKIHETDIFNSITNVLDKVERLHKVSIGIELIGESDDEERYPTPVYRCCSAMIQGIIHYFQGHTNSCIERIEFSSASREHRMAFVHLVHIKGAAISALV
ncbi:uncharacterized protein LOC128211435 isoform X2 [Mya arenaria]|uniref:uncharacterized protein LOC128211435 isoform X2 n=1 Tax=Mya arenaria TaxID=6604 RepID=UPI0022E1D887|nr:uncharacterized protein LOC128211435 isoform X2 [Mya arenaria]